MITKLRAENFKSWKDTGELQLAPLTGLFGTNSSGKSSILQILLMLKQTAESKNRILYTGDEKSLVNLGTFSDLMYNHDLNEKLHLSFSWNLTEPISHVTLEFPSGKLVLFEVNHISFDTVIYEDSFMVVDNFIYEFENQDQIIQFGMRKKENMYNYELIHTNYGAEKVDEKNFVLPNPITCYGFPNEAVGRYKNTGFLPSFVLAFENLFRQISYLGPLRNYPERIYQWSGELPSDVGKTGNNTIATLLAARVKGLKSYTGKNGSDYKLIDEIIQDWLKKIGILESFNLKPLADEGKYYEVKVKKSKSSSEVLITDVGFGVSQILPVLVLCYYVPKGSIILLEQPEIHLHPSVQADLADVLIDVVKYRNVQIIVESHSEHLLRRLQRRIAEEAIPSDMVNLYFCRMDNGTSKIENLELDEYGSIRNWPPNFFGDEMGELSAMTKAAMKRKSLRVSS